MNAQKRGEAGGAGFLYGKKMKTQKHLSCLNFIQKEKTVTVVVVVAVAAVNVTQQHRHHHRKIPLDPHKSFFGGRVK